jgi:hypothetical protein
MSWNCLSFFIDLPVFTNIVLPIFPSAELELGLFDDAVDKFTRALEDAIIRCTQWLPTDKVSRVCPWPEEIF